MKPMMSLAWTQYQVCSTCLNSLIYAPSSLLAVWRSPGLYLTNAEQPPLTTPYLEGLGQSTGCFNYTTVSGTETNDTLNP
jgi:hypothetical protein